MKKAFIVIAMLLIAFSAFAGGKPEEASGKPVAAVTILPEKAFVKAVAGELVDVIVMIPPSASPETYEPTAVQMQALYSASIYFSIEMPSEASILPSVPESIDIVNLAEASRRCYPDLMLGESRDPHIWLSPRRAAVMVDEIALRLGLLLPQYRQEFLDNAQAFKTALEAVSRRIAEALSSLKTREFVCFHPAFNYFADEFGLSMYALEEEGKEATAKRLASMIDLAKEKGLKVIFYQAQVDSRQSKAFAQEVGGKAVMLDPLSETYLGNLESMAEAFSL